ncbi:hypothetical protein [Candidatus Berkiella aquae]|uniref:Uncharacterized protein n=1 Tax=Candidatus Berkiella aquae TaxID=295108 RepID=A0A0Q9YY22_9GAMM|nr:hypothetical protein [Candidatus Berkiella aquae]MCS5710455.1 hypothetical protein [Candidatus Berkiella aquae]
MKNLSINETQQIAGGHKEDDQNYFDKTKEVIDDGLDKVEDGYKKIADKINDKLEHHYCK